MENNKVRRIFDSPIEVLEMIMSKTSSQIDQNVNSERDAYLKGLETAISVLRQEEAFVYGEYSLECIDEVLESFEDIMQEESVENAGIDPVDIVELLEDHIEKIKREHGIHE